MRQRMASPIRRLLLLVSLAVTVSSCVAPGIDDRSTTTFYEIDGLVCRTNVTERVVANLPGDYEGADSRDAAVDTWIAADPLIGERLASLERTESSSGKITFLDEGGRAQWILDVTDPGNGWIVTSYTACADIDG